MKNVNVFGPGSPQECLYLGGYKATCCMSWVHTIYFSTGKLTTIVNAFCLPFGSVSNILVCTGTKVSILRIKYPEYMYWVRAFLLVFKAGGEMPTEESSNGVEKTLQN